MNLFRLLGDGLRTISLIILLHRLFIAKNAQGKVERKGQSRCSVKCKQRLTTFLIFLYNPLNSFVASRTGISLRTHELYLLTYCCRYLDLFTTFYSLYNSVMKIFFLAATAFVIHGVRGKRNSQDTAQDNFQHWKYAALPAFGMGLITNICGTLQRRYVSWSLMELLWTVSIYLESIVAVPQLIVFQRYQDIDFSLRNYIFSMGAYRGLYILNWMYRANFEPHYQHHWAVYICGVIQEAFYVDFFYFYFRHKTQSDYQMVSYPFLERFCQPIAIDDTEENASAANEVSTEAYNLLSEENVIRDDQMLLQHEENVASPRSKNLETTPPSPGPDSQEKDGLLVV